LQPLWEEIATELKGKVNVAKVDVTANRGIGTRFDIKGFPTIKFFRQGQIYDYNGRRSKDAFIQFVTSGYKDAKSAEVPAMPSYFEQIKKSILEPIVEAQKDITAGNYTSPHVFVVLMPLFVLLVLVFTMFALPENVVDENGRKVTPPNPTESKKSD
jgi:thioredoxin-like negative regulator of GroEL